MNGKELATRTLIQSSVVAALVLVLLTLLYAAEVFLVVLAGVLLAILFHNTAAWLHTTTGLPEKWSTAIALVFPFLALGMLIWFMAPDISNQAGELTDRVPKALKELEKQLRSYKWADRLIDQGGQMQDALPSGSKAFDLVSGLFSSTFGALGNLVIALAIGVFIAAMPRTYLSGLIHLIPIKHRDRTRAVLQATRSALASWLTAKLIAMAVIGCLTTLGLWLLEIDLALVLGIIAALLSFVPNIGPIVALVPALLIAFVSGPDQAMYVIALYAAIQTFESYILTPLLQQRMVDLPPALTITMQVLFGFLAGALGIIVATPLTAAAMVMIKMWYIEDILGDRSLESK